MTVKEFERGTKPLSPVNSPFSVGNVFRQPSMVPDGKEAGGKVIINDKMHKNLKKVE
jgi:hypothetical protein